MTAHLHSAPPLIPSSTPAHSALNRCAPGVPRAACERPSARPGAVCVAARVVWRAPCRSCADEVGKHGLDDTGVDGCGRRVIQLHIATSVLERLGHTVADRRRRRCAGRPRCDTAPHSALRRTAVPERAQAGEGEGVSVCRVRARSVRLAVEVEASRRAGRACVRGGWVGAPWGGGGRCGTPYISPISVHNTERYRVLPAPYLHFTSG